nr:MAG TPA: AAA-ATPase Vps4-associated protein 1 [Caudoviricetes sp.]
MREGPFCVIMNIHHRQRATRKLIALFYICDSHR